MEGDASPLSLVHLKGAFAILGCGLIAAAAACARELWRRWRKEITHPYRNHLEPLLVKMRKF